MLEQNTVDRSYKMKAQVMTPLFRGPHEDDPQKVCGNPSGR